MEALVESEVLFAVLQFRDDPQTERVRCLRRNLDETGEVRVGTVPQFAKSRADILPRSAVQKNNGRVRGGESDQATDAFAAMCNPATDLQKSEFHVRNRPRQFQPSVKWRIGQGVQRLCRRCEQRVVSELSPRGV